MKDLFLRFCRWALPLLGVTAAISCDNVIESPDMYGCPPSGYEDIPVMYGTPTVEFSVKGKVMDSEGNPIPGIQISHDYSGQKVLTSVDGTFDCTSEDFGSEKEAVTLAFTDIDGELNGGEFLSKEVAVPVQQTEPGDGAWNYGKFEAENVEIVLTKE